MGRSFHKEIEGLNTTYQYAYDYNETEIKKLSNFLLSLYNKPIFIIGSGGSYSVAKAFEYLHSCSKLPGIAMAVTPLELSTLTSSIHDAGAILISANGNNNDTVNAYKFINRCCPISFLTICLNENSKIRKMNANDSTLFIGNRLPSGKDGYLAVNSILAFLVFITRAYRYITNNDNYLIPQSYDDFYIQDYNDTTTAEALQRESKIVLYSDYASPVAIDIESKFSEAALGNILLADYRNFAHGRHFWLSERTNSTSIISLITPENKTVFSKTISLIPFEVSRLSIETTSIGARGMFELFLSAIYLVEYAGKLLGIDPGKPRVAEYGKKLYHISYIAESAKAMKKNDTLANRAAFRKCGLIESTLFENYISAFSKFRNSIDKVRFNEIIFDFDSTLKERSQNYFVEEEIFSIINSLLSSNIVLNIATGRGKSVRVELREKVLKPYWEKVIVGYYNGGIIAPLSDDKAPIASYVANPFIIQLGNELHEILPDIKYELRPQQLTLMMDDYQTCMYKEIVLEISRKYNKLKVFLSDHSIDIIPFENSKLNLIDKSSNVLCIGDSGQYLGNDYELLSHKYSLSVNRVSASISSCWNYAPVELNNTRATLYYLKQLNINGHYFTLSIF